MQTEKTTFVAVITKSQKQTFELDVLPEHADFNNEVSVVL